MLDSQSMASLAATFCGELISQKDSGFDEARALYNGMIDKRPGMIPRCADVADVITAVKFGRDKISSSPFALVDTAGRGSAAATTVWSELGPLCHLQKSLLSVIDSRDGLHNWLPLRPQQQTTNRRCGVFFKRKLKRWSVP